MRKKWGRKDLVLKTGILLFCAMAAPMLVVMYEYAKSIRESSFDSIQKECAQYAYDIWNLSGLDIWYDKSEKEVLAAELADMTAADIFRNRIAPHLFRAFGSSGYRNELFGDHNYTAYVSGYKSNFGTMDSLIAYYDQDGQLLISSETNYLHFTYETAEHQEEFAWIDLDRLRENEPEAEAFLNFAEAWAYSEENIGDEENPAAAIRASGTISGSEFIPTSLYYYPNSDDLSSYDHIYQEAEMIQVFDHRTEADADVIEIYSILPELYITKDHSFTHNGKLYQKMTGLVQEYLDNGKIRDEAEPLHSYEYDECLAIDAARFEKADTVLARQATIPDTIYVVTAIRGTPDSDTIRMLTPLYLKTTAIMIGIWLLVMLLLRRCIFKPIRIVMAETEKSIADIEGIEGRAFHGKRIYTEMAELQFISDLNKLEKTKLRDENQRLKTAIAYSKTAEDNRRSMINAIAHELKTPLAIIHSYVEGLQTKIAEEKKEKYYRTIQEETERMDAMVYEMLDLSRLEAGRVKLSHDEFSLSEMAKEILEKFSEIIRTNHYQVTLEAPEDVIINADESRIAEVCENYISNAMKYTTKEGSIIVRVKKHGNQVTFEVENSAPHFTEEELTKVFDTFYQGDKSRKSKGTGLGLAIAKNVIQLHGGSCSVKNTELGVEFGFELGR